MKLQQLRFLATVAQSDVALAIGSASLFDKFVLLPCYRWHRQVIVPHAHPLASVRELGFEELGKYPIVTYVFSFTGPSSLSDAFVAHGARPDIALAARDADVIKTYVRLGIGVGIVANMAIDPVDDADLAVLDAGNLFPTHVTWVGFDRARATNNQAETDALFERVKLPQR